MYATNDYLAGLLTADRQHELQAEAAEHHLGRLATSGRPGWWQRLLHRVPDQRPARRARSLQLHHSH